MRKGTWRILQSLVLCALLLATAAVHPIPTSAQDAETRFFDALAGRNDSTSLAGPLSGELVQSAGNIASANAGVFVESFVASATFANPPNPGSIPWDIALAFHVTADTAQFIVVSSEGYWDYAPYPIGSQLSGVVSFDASPGGENTLDLVVDGNSALFGLNGQFITSMQLPPPVASEVQVASAIFNGTNEDGRVIPYSEFQVWSLAASAGQQGAPTSQTGAQEIPPDLPPLVELLEPGLPEETTAAQSAPAATPPVSSAVETPAVSAEDAALFASILADQEAVPPLAGPFTANLSESLDIIALSRANVDLSDFHAHAVMTVPAEDPSGVPWDAGFRFRYDFGGDFRVTVDSGSEWVFAVGADPPAQFGSVPKLALAPGEENTLDLLVQGERAWLGVNGELVATIGLPAGAGPSDVTLGSGFFTDEIVPERVTLFRDFVVRELAPGSLGESVPTETPVPPATPSAADIEAFADYLAYTAETAATAGPFSGRLVEATPGTVPLAPAGVTLADFAAVAQFVNPPESTQTLWDGGFFFRRSDTDRHVIVIDTLGDVYATQPGSGNTKIGNAPSFDPEPGASNTLQLFVVGDRAYFGVNDQFVAAVELTAAPIASDVSLASGFFDEDFSVGRVTDYRDFSVWDLS